MSVVRVEGERTSTASRGGAVRRWGPASVRLQTRRSGRREMVRVGRKSREPTETRRSGGQACFSWIMSATTAAWWAGGWAPVTSRRPSTTSYRLPSRGTGGWSGPRCLAASDCLFADHPNSLTDSGDAPRKLSTVQRILQRADELQRAGRRRSGRPSAGCCAAGAGSGRTARTPARRCRTSRTPRRVRGVARLVVADRRGHRRQNSSASAGPPGPASWRRGSGRSSRRRR